MFVEGLLDPSTDSYKQIKASFEKDLERTKHSFLKPDEIQKISIQIFKKDKKITH